MSTDLQLPQDLPAIRLTSLKIKLPAPSESTSCEACTVQSPDSASEELEAVDCQTPTSSDHKIPLITTCPPAPKKHRPDAPSYRPRGHDILFPKMGGADGDVREGVVVDGGCGWHRGEEVDEAVVKKLMVAVRQYWKSR
ncbi:hypothetical protein R6Q59_019939 [Mikania micrantha]